jgi:uncharacterized membrane protein YoaK (UPF0700 family)
MAQAAHKTIGITRVEWILFSTAFAAGAVDIIGFTNLGGVFASAMTGNMALLAYHATQGNTSSVIGSVIALIGFVTGCVIGFVLRRGRSDRMTINLLLGSETALLLLFAVHSLWRGQLWFASSVHLGIVILAVAMGLQAVVGQMVSHSTIVFTTTLTRLVGGITDAIATQSSSGMREIKDQFALVGSYLAGALIAGALAVHKANGVVFLPLAGVAIALAAHGLFRERPSLSVQS